MKIHSQAPIRIDLSGGTIDIWPIYLLLPDAMTINIGIDLHAEVTLEDLPLSSKMKGKEVTLISEDQGAQVQFSWDDLGKSAVPPGLKIHQRLLAHYAQTKRSSRKSRVILSTLARSPAGAGLGGSSAINIALTGALSAWAKHKIPKENLHELIEVSRDIETQILEVPAGLQDYYGAMFGGLQAIRWNVAQHQRRAYSDGIRKQIEKRLMLFYSGKSRNSGINNWVLFKGLIDGNKEVRKKFELIAMATQELDHALKAQDWKGVGLAIAKEWNTRRTLADGISTPEIDWASAEAMKEGAAAMKICGAGGGGCFFIYCNDDDPGRRRAIQSKLAGRGIKALSFKTVSSGLQVKLQSANSERK